MIRLVLLYGLAPLRPPSLGIELDGAVDRIVARDLSDADVELIKRIDDALCLLQERWKIRGAK